MTLLLAIVLVAWSSVNTFLSITAILGGFNNHKDAELIKGTDLNEPLDMAIEALQTDGENGEGVVAYVCDNRKCGGDCDNCGRTTDIAHAKNFTRISDSYFERLDSVSVVRCKDCQYRKKVGTSLVHGQE